MSSTDSPIEYSCSEEDSISQTVIAAVAEVANCDPIELDPLYHYIDPEALDALFQRHLNETGDQDGVSLEFTYTTYRVTVTADFVHVSTPDETQSHSRSDL